MDLGNVDFEVEVDRSLWRMLCETASALGPAGGGYSWHPEHEDEIDVHLRATDAPEDWMDRVSPAGVYGAGERRIARIHYNGGRPYARIEPEHEPVEPAVPEHKQEAMRRSLEAWLRHKWHDLMRRSGQHYDRGHLPQA